MTTCLTFSFKEPWPVSEVDGVDYPRDSEVKNHTTLSTLRHPFTMHQNTCSWEDKLDQNFGVH